MPKIKIKKGDTVKIIAGAVKKDTGKGATGKVLRILPEDQRVVVEGCNIIKKHVKPSAQNPEGGIVEKEAPIHISNVALVIEGDGKDAVTSKVGRKLEDGKLKRFAKKTDKILD
jgi:large subunit ribosomal protein L24